MYCETDKEYEDIIGKALLITHVNEKRFLMKDYSSETPLKKEGALRFFEIPVRPLKRSFHVTET